MLNSFFINIGPEPRYVVNPKSSGLALSALSSLYRSRRRSSSSSTSRRRRKRTTTTTSTTLRSAFYVFDDLSFWLSYKRRCRKIPRNAVHWNRAMLKKVESSGLFSSESRMARYQITVPRSFSGSRCFWKARFLDTCTQCRGRKYCKVQHFATLQCFRKRDFEQPTGKRCTANKSNVTMLWAWMLW